MNNDRREFLKKSAITTVGAFFLPQFLQAYSPLNLDGNNRRLVIIQLSGGNDSLNTVIPYNNSLYYEHRPTLAIAEQKVLKLNKQLGLHYSLSFFQDLLDKGEMNIINQVGYPNPNRSHFRSMDIWHTANISSASSSEGWLGKYLDEFQGNTNKNIYSHQAIDLSGGSILALQGQKRSGFGINSGKLIRGTNDHFLQQIQHHQEHTNSQVDYLYQVLANTYSSSEYILEKMKTKHSHQEYPSDNLGKQLKQTADLITAGCNTEIYYLKVSGFDTHNSQLPRQERLLKQLNHGIQSFVKDLRRSGLWNSTRVMIFSEFGRRVKENGSKGTDHGAAGSLFLLGGKLKSSGIYNASIDLENLEKGDVQYKIDFRRVYAELLDNWLEFPSNTILGETFKSMNIV
ncbi:DUF1501 domain-containing protein [Algivirga pacifica]|uniref:DUF1501 domain-containing protein n=1 Tax=Algivirga pacifica TaxID=1162670 RepID=A0ABP9D3B1_9BACT